MPRLDGYSSLGGASFTGLRPIRATSLSVSGESVLSSLVVSGNATLSNISLSGNTNFENIIVSDTISASGNTSLANVAISGLTSTGTLSASGNTSLANVAISGLTSTDTLSASGNTSLTNASLTGVLSVSGNTTIANVSSTGTITANTLSANTLSVIPSSNTGGDTGLAMLKFEMYRGWEFRQTGSGTSVELSLCPNTAGKRFNLYTDPVPSLTNTAIASYTSASTRYLLLQANTITLSGNVSSTSTLSVSGNTTLSSNVAVGSAYILSGTGSPESVKTAGIGSIYLRTDGGANTSFYVKESGTGSTGWIAK